MLEDLSPATVVHQLALKVLPKKVYIYFFLWDRCWDKFSLCHFCDLKKVQFDGVVVPDYFLALKKSLQEGDGRSILERAKLELIVPSLCAKLFRCRL